MCISENNRYLKKFGTVLITGILLAEFIGNAVNISNSVSLVNGTFGIVIVIVHTGSIVLDGDYRIVIPIVIVTVDNDSGTVIIRTRRRCRIIRIRGFRRISGIRRVSWICGVCRISRIGRIRGIDMMNAAAAISNISDDVAAQIVSEVDR